MIEPLYVAAPQVLLRNIRGTAFGRTVTLRSYARPPLATQGHVDSAGLRNSRNILRIMRKSPAALKALFPTVRGEILAATLSQPDKWWYLSELAQFLKTTPSTLQRDLKALVDGGILQQRREGTRAYFKADTRSPLFTDLRGLVEKTAGLRVHYDMPVHPSKRAAGERDEPTS